MKPYIPLLSTLLLAPSVIPKSGKSGDLVERAPLAFASLLTDHLVLQRDKPVPVWGTLTPSLVHAAGLPAAPFALWIEQDAQTRPGILVSPSPPE